VKVSPKDEAAIRAGAERYGMSVSEYMRASAMLHLALDGDGYALGQFTRGAVQLAMRVWDRVRVLLADSEIARR
jgi:hypothetical protein